MTQLVTVVITLLAGAVVITMTAPPTVAVITVCAVSFLLGVLAKRGGRL